MKNKIIFVVVLLSISMLAYSIYKNNSSIELKNFPYNAQIISFEEKEIYYYINKSEDGFRDFTIFIYDMEEGTNSELATFSNTDYIITNLLSIHNNVYVINKESQDEYSITKINKEDKTKSKIYTWHGNISFNYLFNLGDNLVLMNINTLYNKNEYTIDIINISTLKSERIVSKEYDKENRLGTIISSISVSDNFIYSFENVENTGKTKFKIVKYNVKGEEIESHNLMIDDFLQSEDPDIYLDAVIDIYVEGDYYILSTLNKRKQMYKKSNEELIKINIPSELYDRYPSMYRMLPVSKENSIESYFIDSFSEKKEMIVFNSEEGKFYKIQLPQTIKDYNMVYRNEKGDLIIQTSDKSYLMQRDHMMDRLMIME